MIVVRSDVTEHSTRLIVGYGTIDVMLGERTRAPLRQDRVGMGTWLLIM